MRPVACVIHGVTGVCNRVHAVDVVDVAVVVIIDAVSCDLTRILPHVVDEVGMVVIDASVDYDHYLRIRTNGGIPRS